MRFPRSSGDPGRLSRSLLLRKGKPSSSSLSRPSPAPTLLQCWPLACRPCRLLSQGVLRTLQPRHSLCEPTRSLSPNTPGSGSQGSVLPDPLLHPLLRPPSPRTLSFRPSQVHDKLTLWWRDHFPSNPGNTLASFLLFQALVLGQAWVSGRLAGEGPSSRTVQLLILWSGIGARPTVVQAAHCTTSGGDCWVRGQTHTQPHRETNRLAE